MKIKTLAIDMSYKDALKYESSQSKYRLLNESDPIMRNTDNYWIKKESDNGRAFIVSTGLVTDVSSLFKCKVKLVKNIENCTDTKTIFVIEDNLMESILANEPMPISWKRLSKLCPLCEYIDDTKKEDYFEFIKEN